MSDTRLADLADLADQLRLRMLQDALAEATGDYWTRRAEQLEWCRPRPGDFVGKATPQQIAERDRRLARDAAACRRHAAVCNPLYGLELEITEALDGSVNQRKAA